MEVKWRKNLFFAPVPIKRNHKGHRFQRALLCGNEEYYANSVSVLKGSHLWYPYNGCVRWPGGPHRRFMTHNTVFTGQFSSSEDAVSFLLLHARDGDRDSPSSKASWFIHVKEIHVLVFVPAYSGSSYWDKIQEPEAASPWVYRGGRMPMRTMENILQANVCVVDSVAVQECYFQI